MKESNYTEIVMSSEFETLEQTLMVEIVRRRQMPVVRPLADPQFDTTGKCETLVRVLCGKRPFLCGRWGERLVIRLARCM